MQVLSVKHLPCPEHPLNKAQFAGVTEVTGVEIVTGVKTVAGVEIVPGVTGVIGVLEVPGITGVAGGTRVTGGYTPKQSLLCQIAEHDQT